MTGLDYVPDVKALAAFDPAGTHRDLLNSSYWLLTPPRYDEGPVRIGLVPPNVLRFEVSPFDPALKRHGCTLRRIRRAAPNRDPVPTQALDGLAGQRVLAVSAALIAVR